MKKRVLATLLSVTMLASVLAGCGGDTASSDSGSEAGQTAADTTESSAQATETTEASDSEGGRNS